MFCPIPWFTNNPIEEEYSTIRKLRQKNATLAPQEYLSYQQGTASRSSSAASLNEQDEKEIPKTPEEDISSAVIKESTIEATFTAKTEPPTPGTSLCENSIVTEDDVEDDSQSTVEAATEDYAEDDSQSTAEAATEDVVVKTLYTGRSIVAEEESQSTTEAATEDVVVKTLYTGRSIVVEEESQSAIDAAADTSPVANINSATDAKASPIRPQAISFEQVSQAVDEKTAVVDSDDKRETKLTTSAFPKPLSVLVVLLAIALALLFGNNISELTGSIVNVATDYQAPFPFETAEVEKLAKEEAVRNAERLAKEDAARKAKAAEAERLAKEEAARKAKAAEAERLAKAAELERLAKEAREAKAAEAERLAKEEAVRRAMLERRLANEEAARKAEATEAETLAKEEAAEAEKLTEESDTEDVTASVDSDEELEVDTD